MKSDERALKELVDLSIPTPSDREMKSRCDRVLQSLQSANIEASEFTRFQPEPILSRQTPWRVAVICAAVAAAFVLALSPTIWKTPDSSTTRTLADGSRIELQAGAEAVVENVPDGLMVRLNSGSMMVFAAKQAAGRHLYVQTRDLNVSVVGTVFLVDADDKGSRVAVIEGEVRVQQGTVEKSLLPGEQLSSRAENRQFFQETGWSREAYAYLSKLHESMAQSLAARQSAGRTTSVSDKPKFEEASIRPCDQDIPGVGGRGTSSGAGGSGSIRISPGRVDALCLTVPTLIFTAHRALDNNSPGGGRGRRALRMNETTSLLPVLEDQTYVRGGPDWVRSQKYTIAAIGDSTDAPTLQGPMLLDLLERRFKLKLRVETEEIPVYALTIAKGGLNMRPIEIESAKYEELRKIRASLSLARQPRSRQPVQEGPDPGELDKLGATYSGLLGCSLLPQAAQDDPVEANRFREAVRRGVQPPECLVTSSGGIHGPNSVIVFATSPISTLVTRLTNSSFPGSSPSNTLIDTLNGLLVVDRTNLPVTNCLIEIPPAGTPCAPLFNIVLEFANDESYFANFQQRTGMNPALLGADLSLPKAPNVFNALEKLGLHLEKSKASREFIVIEHIERPSPN